MFVIQLRLQRYSYNTYVSSRLIVLLDLEFTLL